MGLKWMTRYKTVQQENVAQKKEREKTEKSVVIGIKRLDQALQFTKQTQTQYATFPLAFKVQNIINLCLCPLSTLFLVTLTRKLDGKFFSFHFPCEQNKIQKFRFRTKTMNSPESNRVAATSSPSSSNKSSPVQVSPIFFFTNSDFAFCMLQCHFD